MPEICGLPSGLAARRLGFDPVDWQARVELRARVVRDMDEARATAAGDTTPTALPSTSLNRVGP